MPAAMQCSIMAAPGYYTSCRASWQRSWQCLAVVFMQEEVAIMRAEHRVLIGQLERARAAMQHGHAVGGALIHQQQSIDEEEQARWRALAGAKLLGICCCH